MPDRDSWPQTSTCGLSFCNKSVIPPVSESPFPKDTGPTLLANTLPLQRFVLLGLRTKIGHSLGTWLEAEHLTRTRPRREERRTEEWLGTHISDKYRDSYSVDKGQPALAPPWTTVGPSSYVMWPQPGIALTSVCRARGLCNSQEYAGPRC